MPKLKAYQVREDGEGHCVIQFATSNAAARREGGSRLDLAFEEVESCRRAPQFDAYAPGPVPVTVLLADGWWQECLHCGQKIDLEYQREDDDGNEVDFEPIDHGDQVFCCPACQAKHFAEKRANQAARAALVEMVETLYPGAQVTRVHVYGDRLESSEPGHGIKSSADFNFPGCTGIASYHFGEPHVYVHRDDVEKFQALYRRGDQPAA